MYQKFNFTSDWSDAVYAKRNSIVFENKNQAYGAYVIRTTYERNLIIALFASFIFFASLILVPMLLNHPAIPLLPVAPEILTPTILTETPIIIPDIKVMPVHPPSTSPTTPQLDLLHLQMTNNDKADTTEAMIPINPPENPNPISTGGNGNGPNIAVNPIITPPAPDPNKIVLGAQEMPSFPGGEPDLFKYLDHELRYPGYSLENHIEGTVYLSFVINRDGSVGDIKILRGVDNFLNDEAIRVVKKMPKWNPGKQNGNAVRVQLNLPVKFKIRQN